MVTLGFILDQLLGDVPGGIGRYTENLAREVIKRAPEGTRVEGLTAMITAEQEQQLYDRLHGLSSIRSAKLTRRALSTSRFQSMSVSQNGDSSTGISGAAPRRLPAT